MNAPVGDVQGLREVTLWLPDLDAPGFREKLAADIARINAAEDAAETERWLDAALEDLERSIQAAESDANA